MVQNFNPAGIFFGLKILFKPGLFVPHLTVHDIRCVDFYQLRNAGIRAVAFDKDNCLTEPYKDELYPPFKDAWEECRRAFGDKNVIIVSNSAGTPDDKDHVQATRIEKSLQVKVLRHEEKKPACSAAVVEYFAESDKSVDGTKLSPGEIRPSEIAFIGDRIFTDVAFGNSGGMLTIWTRRIVTERGDNFWAKKIRRLEYIMVDALVACGTVPPDHQVQHSNFFSKIIRKE